jgi:hypothetical protein
VVRFAGILIRGGVLPLLWHCYRLHADELSDAAARICREAYLTSCAQAIQHEAELQRIAEALHDARIRSVLLKGWSVSRLYPEVGLRPSGDIDLWIDPGQHADAERIVRSLAPRCDVDLHHDQLRRFEDRSFAEVYSTCETIALNSVPVTVLPREDQVRFLCLHFLKHGGWRAIWLCDIAQTLRSCDHTFDWSLCLGTNARYAGWIASTLSLARELLGADLPSGAPPSLSAGPPLWYTRAVLREWGTPGKLTAPALSFLRESPHRPSVVYSFFRGRWRNPVQAAVECNGSFGRAPGWCYQLWNIASLTTRSARQLLHS